MSTRIIAHIPWHCKTCQRAGNVEYVRPNLRAVEEAISRDHWQRCNDDRTTCRPADRALTYEINGIHGRIRQPRKLG